MDMQGQLLGLIEKYDLINRTYEYFWENYDGYLAEEPKEAAEKCFFNRESIETPFVREVKFILTGLDINDSCTIRFSAMQLIAVDLAYFHKEITYTTAGSYQCVFDMNGEVLDDFFVVD